MKASPILILLALFAAFILFMSSAYTVGEQEQVIITQFGKPVGEAINSDPDPAKSEAGLHFKTPFVQEVNRFEKRTLEWDGPSTAMSTREKQTIVVDAFARWRISDPLKYLKKITDERKALSRLDDTVGTAVRSVIAAHDLVEVIRTDKARTAPKPEAVIPPPTPSAPGVPAPSMLATSAPGVLPKIKYGRVELEKQVLEQASTAVADWGITLLDVRFKRINYNPSVADKIHERMISERMQIAESFRSDGAGEAAKIDGRRGKELQQIESEAYRKVQELQGKADAEASEIYAKAYNTSPSAADFYKFSKTLDTYKTTLGQDSTLILTTDSDFFRFLKRTDGASDKAPVSPAAP